MKLDLKPTMRCKIAADSKWAHRAAVCLGAAFFLRIVYYFGLTNLSDLVPPEIIFSALLPLMLNAALIVMLKRKSPDPRAAGIAAAANAVSYFLATELTFANVLCELLLLATAALFLAACLGLIPRRRVLLLAGAVTLCFRLIFVDILGHLLPLHQFQPLEYILQSSGLFLVAAIAFLCETVRIRAI